MLAFVAYTLSGHELEPSVAFTALALFQLLRMPLMFLRMSSYSILPVLKITWYTAHALASVVDAQNALNRIQAVLDAETLPDTAKSIDLDLKTAIEVDHASFTWDSAASDTTAFALQDLNLNIARGALVAIVGPIGSGKTSLLEGLVGEMRRTDGSVTFGGSVSYCTQVPWISNTSVRDNITFGRPFNADRYWEAVEKACLGLDLEALPHGDRTEVGEKVTRIEFAHVKCTDNTAGSCTQRWSEAARMYCSSSIRGRGRADIR
jgi:ABC-type multidrug transport system fused ATPase/permease subunit